MIDVSVVFPAPGVPGQKTARFSFLSFSFSFFLSFFFFF